MYLGASYLGPNSRTHKVGMGTDANFILACWILWRVMYHLAGREGMRDFVVEEMLVEPKTKSKHLGHLAQEDYHGAVVFVACLLELWVIRRP